MSSSAPTGGASPPTAIDLSGVPETALWPLWNRAMDMSRADRLVEDPMAAELVDRIDYDFRGHFGRPSAFHSIRARVGDDLIRDYLSRTQDEPVVVGLGEGLDHQLWRIDDQRVRWITVDLPELIHVRQRLLPSHPRASLVAGSALDPAWMGTVPAGAPPFITAGGVLMYFTENDVRALLSRIAERFPGAEIFFDAIPPFASRRTLNGAKVTKLYTAPPMPWGISVDDLPGFLRSIPNLDPVTVQTYADPFPHRLRFYWLLSFIPPVRRTFAGSLAHARVLTS
ncbi:MAG: class I SAM-dependent methyltransferase [Acidobacteria bacterium]|nr:class I SAM-dependent methyltransferase [Acidobacteriota bacterium]MYJ04678.1 class I SAM-dependent methyltransferase [Acidobacteriota bacterium]